MNPDGFTETVYPSMMAHSPQSSGGIVLYDTGVEMRELNALLTADIDWEGWHTELEIEGCWCKAEINWLNCAEEPDWAETG